MKYMGSKSRIAKYIIPIIQSGIDKFNASLYIEPFVGGGNVIDKIKCKIRIGYDNNKYLIALLNEVKTNPNALYDKVSRELYNLARDEYNSGNITSFEDWQIGNIGFLASYNGRFFDGGYAQAGYETTKNKIKYRDYYKESKNNLIKQAPMLADIHFIPYDYRDVNASEAVIYCDPPYQNKKKFDSAKQFDYSVFWMTMNKWSENNLVFVSELSAPDDWVCIWEKEVSRSIKAHDKSKEVEKLFVHKNNLKYTK